MRKMENTRFVNKGIVKKDAKALLSGRPVYTDDIEVLMHMHGLKIFQQQRH